MPDNIKLVSKRVEKLDGFDVQYKIDDWGTSFQANVTIKNNTDIPIEAWTLTFGNNFNVANVWNARMINSNENSYTIASQAWTNPIQANSSLAFSFTGSKEAGLEVVIDSFVLTEVIISSSFNPEDVIDSDSDGLPDDYEINVSKTDPNNADTDGDRLPDGYEVITLHTDPTVTDTDGNGITDDLEDFDSDGLTNYQEYMLETDPLDSDTDGDKLSDYEEINSYYTSPILFDTDGDSIGDGDELEIELDPLNPQTHGIPDNQYTFPQTINEELLSSVNQDNLYNVEIEIVSAGNANNSIAINESPYTNSLQNNDAIFGKVIEIKYIENLKVDSATVEFTIPESNIGSPTGMYDDSGLAGVQRFQVFKYDTKANLMYPVNTEFDTANNTLTATTKELGNYIILDLDKWMYNLGISPAAPELPQVQAINFAMTTNIMAEDETATELDDSEIPDDMPVEEPKEPEELPANYDEIMQEQIENILGINAVPFNTAPRDFSELPNYNKQIDLVFAIDTSGSMGGTINTCKQKLAVLVNDLYNAGITANIGIVTFGDYRQENIVRVLDGSVWAKTPQKAAEMISKVDLYAWGLENHLDVMETIMGMPFRSNALKFAVLITDEPIALNNNNCYRNGKKTTNDIANELKQKGIVTSVVSYNSSTFEPLYQETEGIQTSVSGDFHSYLYAFIAGYLQNNKTYTYIGANDLCTKMLKAPIVRNGDTDSDSDGLTDWEETDNQAINFFTDGPFEDGAIINVPTFTQYVSYMNVFDATQFDRINKYYADEIAMLRILPIVSDPMSKDGDKDEILDNYDSAPLIYDELLNYFFVYSNKGSDFIKQAEWMANYAYKKKDVEYIYMTKKNEFIEAWNNRLGQRIQNIHLYFHGGANILFFYKEQMELGEFAELENITLQNKVYLYSCKGGTQENETCVAWEIAKHVSGKPVYALANDSVDYFNWGFLKWFEKLPLRHDETGYWANFYATKDSNNNWILTEEEIEGEWKL